MFSEMSQMVNQFRWGSTGWFFGLIFLSLIFGLIFASLKFNRDTFPNLFANTMRKLSGQSKLEGHRRQMLEKKLSQLEEQKQKIEEELAQLKDKN